MIGQLFRIVLAGIVLVLFAASPSRAQILVRDAAGGLPVQMVVKNDNVKIGKARDRIAQSGLPRPDKDATLGFTLEKRDGTYVNFQRLEDLQGKVILPPIYARVKPVSTVAALVQRNDGKWGIAEFETGKFRPLPSWNPWLYNTLDGKTPALLMIGIKSGDTYRHCFTDVMGKCDIWIDRITDQLVPEQPGSGGYIVGNKIILNRIDDSGKKFSTSFTSDGEVFFDKGPPVIGIPIRNSGVDYRPVAITSVMYDLGPLGAPLGDYQPNLYWPIDDNGYAINPRTNFKGMFPLTMQQRIDPKAPYNFDGWALVLELDDARIFYIVPSEENAIEAEQKFTGSLWLDLHFQEEEKTKDSTYFSLAGLRMNGENPDMWLPLIGLRSNSYFGAKLAEAQKLTEGFASPMVAIEADAARTAEAKLAAARNNQLIRDRRNAILADLRSSGNSVRVNSDFCYQAQLFAGKRTDAASQQFLAAHKIAGNDVCNYLPRSIYNAMYQAKAPGTQPAPMANREKSFSELMQDSVDEARRTSRANRGKTLKCFVKDGRQFCDYQ